MAKIAWFVTHPIQYYSPMYEIISNDEDIKLDVFYFSDFSTGTYIDKEFGNQVSWDTPLLQGHSYKVLKNISAKQHGGFFSYINRGILKEVLSGKYDLVVVHGWSTLSHLIVILACVLTRTPYSIRGDSNAISIKKNNFKNKLRNKFLKCLFKLSSVIFYVGKQNKLFYKNYDVNEEQLIRMPLSVNNDYFLDFPLKNNLSDLKKELNISEEKPILLFSGKLIEKKQPKMLIEALSKLTIDCQLLIVGNGEQMEELKIMSQRLGVDTVFYGFINQSEIPKFYWGADVLVMPSSYEPWGLSINEAMNCNCAVIVSDKVGAKDDLVCGNGYVFQSDSVSDLVEKIELTVADRVKLKKMKSCSQAIIKKYSYSEDLSGLKRALQYIGCE